MKYLHQKVSYFEIKHYLCSTKLVSFMETTKKYNGNLPVMTQIRAMEKGDMLVLPLDTYASIKANLSVYGTMLRRKYSSHVNREKSCLEVTRVQ